MRGFFIAGVVLGTWLTLVVVLAIALWNILPS